jgi:hypothetical protein
MGDKTDTRAGTGCRKQAWRKCVRSASFRLFLNAAGLDQKSEIGVASRD